MIYNSRYTPNFILYQAIFECLISNKNTTITRENRKGLSLIHGKSSGEFFEGRFNIIRVWDYIFFISEERAHTWLYDLARWALDKKLAPIKVCHSDLEATESLHQADTLGHMKVTAFTIEILKRKMKKNLMRHLTHCFKSTTRYEQHPPWINHNLTSTTNTLSIMPGQGFIEVCTSCSFSCSTSTMSPGSMFGAWSASPEKVIFWPCFMPLSTCTSRSLFSLQTFWPSHFLQRSFSLINSPTLGKE